MVFCNALLLLLSVTNAWKLTDDQIRLAIDISADDMRPGEKHHLIQWDAPSRSILIRLLNEHPKLLAFAVKGTVIVERLK